MIPQHSISEVGSLQSPHITNSVMVDCQKTGSGLHILIAYPPTMDYQSVGSYPKGRVRETWNAAHHDPGTIWNPSPGMSYL